MSLVLRPMVLADAEALAAWATDPVFCAHAGWRPRSRPESAVSWWRDTIEHPDPVLTRLLAVQDGETVGYVDLHGGDDDVRELGFVVGPSSRWGQGRGTAAAVAGLSYGFTTLGLSRIWAEAVEANTGSVRILRRIGMRETGTGDAEDFLGVPSRYLRFSLSRREWQARDPVPVSPPSRRRRR